MFPCGDFLSAAACAQIESSVARVPTLLDELNLQEPSNLIGLFGVLTYLGSYFLLQIGQIRGHGYAYPTLVTIAAASVLYGLKDNFNLPSAMIQISFIAISLIGILQLVARRMMARFTPDELRFIQQKFPYLDRPRARRFLDHGEWTHLPAGTVLTTFGHPVHELVFVQDGMVACEIDGRVFYGHLHRRGPDAVLLHRRA